jgi:2-polyprenyl-6-methoxyphenol hydroxylase-like FAD-dependent oxidoreductase
MFGKHQPDVLVVGAGPVGLLVSWMLSQRGVDVEVVDEEWRTGVHAYALALHPESMRILEDLGLLEEVLKPALRVDTVALYTGSERRVEVKLSSGPEKYPFLAVLPQSALEGILEKRLREGKIKVRWNHRFARLEQRPDRVAAVVDRLEKQSSGYGFSKTEWVVEKSRVVEPRFVVGADGHRSVVRTALDIPFDLLGPADFFAVFEFEAEGEVPAEVRLVLDDEVTSVFWPLGHGRGRWSFQFRDADIGRESRRKARLMVELGSTLYPHVSEEDFASFLRERAPWFTASIRSIAWSLAIRFEPRLARSFGRDRVWLVGDAGHTTGPAGIQSMNVGFREALDLTGRLAEALQQGGSPAALASYEQERLAEWRRLLGLEGKIVARPDASAWVTERAARILPCLPASGTALQGLLNQLGLALEG